MNYHGIGGVGKSSLLRRLEAELLEEAELPEDEARTACERARASLQAWCRALGRGKSR